MNLLKFWIGFVMLCAINPRPETYSQVSHPDSIAQNATRLPVELTSFFDFLDSLSQVSNLSEHMSRLSEVDIKRAARLWYVANETDAFAVERGMAERNNHWKTVYEKQIKLVPSTPSQPAVVKGALSYIIKTKLSPHICDLVRVPIFLKGKILSESTHYYKSKAEPWIGAMSRREIEMTLDEIIKGNSRFHIGDKICFFFMPEWREDWAFQIGETCFVGLEPRITLDGDSLLALVVYLDNRPGNSYGRYPIVDGYIVDQKNTFGAGERVKWEEFHLYIDNEINAIKSW